LSQPAAPEAVLAKIEQKVEVESLLDFIPNDALKVMQHVVAGEKTLKAMHLLTYTAIKQIGKVEETGGGTEELDNLRKTADSMAKLELGREILRGRRGYMPEIASGDTSASAIAKTMMEFDGVDRSILRELSVNYIEMIRGASSGKFEAVGLEGQPARAAGTVDGEQSGTFQPPIDPSA